MTVVSGTTTSHRQLQMLEMPGIANRREQVVEIL
jgi:hypothetical protein